MGIRRRASCLFCAALAGLPSTNAASTGICTPPSTASSLSSTSINAHSYTVTLGYDTYVCLVLNPLVWSAGSTGAPTPSPTPSGTSPTNAPTATPTAAPTPAPTATPTNAPTAVPTNSPAGTPGPTSNTTASPTPAPTVNVSTVSYSNTSYSRVVLSPRTDSFSRITIPGSWTGATNTTDPLLKKYGNNVGFHIESMGMLSFQKAFRLAGLGRTYSVFTALITVDKGKVTGITFDDGCHFCADAVCDPNTYNFGGNLTTLTKTDCYWDDATCLDSTTGEVADVCQLTVYIAWTGTDKNGNYLTSVDKRLSLYSSGAVQNFIEKSKTAKTTYTFSS